MSAVGLRPVMQSTVESSLLTLNVSNACRIYQPPLASTSFRGQRLGCVQKLVHHQRKREFTWKIVSIAEPPTRTEEAKKEGDNNSYELEKSSKPQEQHASDSKKFNWNTQWYPIAVTKDLNKDSPRSATILGRPLAVWWDRTTDRWQVYADKCPHRLAPLSEGSITAEGHLRCSYHGWSFRGDSGECSGIPQAPSDGPAVHASRRACATVYPSMEQQGLLWFWPDLSQGSVNVEAAASPPPNFPELSDPTFAFDLSMRDLEYGYDTLIENLMDPAHVNFAHHKIQGNRAAATPLNFKVKELQPSGYIGEGDRSGARFYAPCTFRFEVHLSSTKIPKEHIAVSAPVEAAVGTILPWSNLRVSEVLKQEYLSWPREITGFLDCLGNLSGNPVTKLGPQLLSALSSKKTQSSKDVQQKVVLIFLCIPVSPGRSRLIWSFPRNIATALFKVTPRWITHMTNNLVLDSDLLLLHLLGKRLEAEGEEKWEKCCYVPTTADAFVVGFRKWLRDFAAGGPDWAGRFDNKLPPSPPRRIILDRYYNHVKQCKSCSRALANFRAIEVGLQAIAIALVGLVATAAVIPISSLRPLSVPLVAAAVLSTLLSRWVAHFIYTTFYFHDYNHAEVK